MPTGLLAAQRRYDALTSRRGEFAAALRGLQEELRASPPLFKLDLTTAEWLALTGYTWAQQLVRAAGGAKRRAVPPLQHALLGGRTACLARAQPAPPLPARDAPLFAIRMAASAVVEPN